MNIQNEMTSGNVLEPDSIIIGPVESIDNNLNSIVYIRKTIYYVGYILRDLKY